MLLKGKPVVAKLFEETKIRLKTHKKMKGFVAIFLLSDDSGSEKYVALKSEYAKKLGIFADIKFGKDRSKEEILEEIDMCNTNPLCLGIMVQLPLDEKFKDDQEEILERITPEKDVDGLTSARFGRHGFDYDDVLGATPRSAFAILDHYELGDMEGKYVCIISQSNLIGKWLAHACMHRGATVLSGNHFTSTARLAEMVGMSELIFSATGVKHLINGESMREKGGWMNKIFIDIGRGIDSSGAYGDIAWKHLQNKVKAVTPVPGGVGPVTVACLFHNITRLNK